MKKKQPSNVFALPKWMIGLKAREPEGTYTPDHVSAVMEMNLIFNGDVASLRSCIQTLIPLVPLKRQKTLKAFLSAPDEDIITVVQAFIEMINLKLVPILQEATNAHIREKLTDRPSGESDLSGRDSEWGDDWDRTSKRKPSTRGHRALLAAKRGQAET